MPTLFKELLSDKRNSVGSGFSCTKFLGSRRKGAQAPDKFMNLDAVVQSLCLAMGAQETHKEKKKGRALAF